MEIHRLTDNTVDLRENLINKHQKLDIFYVNINGLNNQKMQLVSLKSLVKKSILEGTLVK